VSFGVNQDDAIKNVTKTFNQYEHLDDPDIYMTAIQIRSRDDMPKDIADFDNKWIDNENVFGIDEESFFEYFEAEERRKQQEELDKNHNHFGFWNEVKRE